MVEIPKYLTAISHILGGWFISGLAFEVINLNNPEVVVNNTDNTIYLRVAMCFMVAVTFIMINFTWKKNT
jgi:hypothetical protein